MSGVVRKRRWWARGGRGRAPFMATVLAGACVVVGAATGVAEGQSTSLRSAEARETVRRAADLMGGEARLREVRHVSFDMMTQWMRTSFRSVPFTDRPSFEKHQDVRDYSIRGWRNTRDFGARSITNIIRDTISVTDMGAGFRPLSVAYVDERDELFTYTPDRLVLALLDAEALSTLPDTVLGDEPHHVVRARLAPGHGYVRSTDVFFHAGTGLPTAMRFRAGHPADFGLVQWGEMDVEVWYSSWGTFGGVSIPRQWDVVRVGVPYKRMTVLAADFDPDFAADSFAVSDSLRAAYHESPAVRPMHEGRDAGEVEHPVDGIALLSSTFGIPLGAVRAGSENVLLGAGRMPYNFDQAYAALADAGVAPTSVLLARTMAGNGGVSAAAERGIPVLVSEGAAPFVRRVLDGGGHREVGLDVVHDRRTIGSGDERLILEPMDLPDAPGSLIVYRPASGWLWVPDGRDALAVRMARERAAELGWVVRVLGAAERLWQPAGGA